MKIPPHGGQLHRIAEQFGVPVEGLLDFSANINPDGPPAGVVAALLGAMEDPRVLGDYPDLEEAELRAAVAAYAGARVEEVAVANGFVPLLDAALRTLAVRSCLLPVPAFGEYRAALERAGVVVGTIVLEQAADFRYQAARLLRALRDGGHDAILLANPQNPSGVLWERDGLAEFVEDAGRRGVCVLLDEAFIDYAPGNSLVGDVGRFPGLVVFRSVTKFHGTPGLRVAYAVAGEAVNGAIRRSLAPWAITTLAAIGVRAALADGAYAERSLRLNAERREGLAAQVRALGLHAYPAAANFLLLRFSTIAMAQGCWERLILEHGIVLRNCKNFEGLGQDHLRCAVRDEEQNARLVEALHQVIPRDLQSAG